MEFNKACVASDAKQLKDNAVWKGLAFVKDNRTYALGGDTWMFGGPLSAKVVGEKAAATIIARSEGNL